MGKVWERYGKPMGKAVCDRHLPQGQQLGRKCRCGFPEAPSGAEPSSCQDKTLFVKHPSYPLQMYYDSIHLPYYDFSEAVFNHEIEEDSVFLTGD